MDRVATIKTDTPTRISSVKNPTAWLIGWLPAALGLAAWLASFFDVASWMSWLNFLGIFTAIAISVCIHELAHFAVGRYFGLKPWCLRIGHGQVVFDKEFYSFRLILQSLPYSGAVYPYIAGGKTERLGMIWAGPLSNAVLFMIFLPGFLKSDLSDFDSFSMEWFMANAYLLLATALPRQTSTGPNDGMMIIHLLTGTRPKFERGSMPDLAPSWDWMMRNHSAEYLLAQYREVLSNSKLSDEQRCILLDTFVTGMLISGAIQFLPDADQYSEELLRLQPTDWAAKATRGCVLVEKGDLAPGIRMLEEVVASEADKFNRAISASFLALAQSKQQNHAEALRWLASARELDAGCPTIHRIENFLRSKTAVG